MAEPKKVNLRGNLPTYSQSQIEEAINAVEGGMSTNGAARAFGIPKTTLRGYDYLYSQKFDTLTKSSVYWYRLKNNITHSFVVGFYPFSIKGLRNAVAFIIQADERPNPFPNGRPGNNKYTTKYSNWQNITSPYFGFYWYVCNRFRHLPVL